MRIGINLGIRVYTNSRYKFSMRIDSCRKCGNGLSVSELCPDCRQPIHFECGKCSKFVDDPIHSHQKFLFI